MHVVAISSWKEVTTELAQALATALGITAFEARPRLMGSGPAVVASLADAEKAAALEKKLNQIGFTTLIVDAMAVRTRTDHFIVRRFQFNTSSLLIETNSRHQEAIPFEEIDLLLPATHISGTSEMKTITERKLSIGKTLLSGGIPMTHTVEHQEEVTKEARGKILYLYAGQRSPAIFSQNGMIYDGFGAAMKLTRELNFAHLTNELRRICPQAGYDDRLLNRAGQARLLGPTITPETSLDLAADILARSMRRR